jgi:hypothetical protein
VEQSPDVDPIETPFLKLKTAVLESEMSLQDKADALEIPFPDETTD